MPDSQDHSATPTYDALSVADKAFVDDLIAGKPQYKAYRDNIYSGNDPSYSYLSRAASRKVRNGIIRQALSERYAQEAMPDPEAARILAAQARASLDPFLRFDSRTGLYEIDLSTPEARAHIHLIKKIHQKKRIIREKDGSTRAIIEHRIELYDSQDAAHKLRQAHGAYGAKGTETDPIHHAVERVEIVVTEKPPDAP